MHWWEWTRARRALETWVRVLIGPRPYAIRFCPGKGSFVRFDTQEIVVDPVMADSWGGAALLPVSWRGQSVTTLPSLQWRIARALARHEAGHVLFTAAHPVDGALHAWLTNALEDERMERLTGAYAPPARADFRALARLLAARLPLPDPAKRPPEDTLLNACLFHRWDAVRLPGTPSRLRFRADSDHRLWDAQVRPLVEEAWQAASVHHVAEIAREILRRIGLPATSGATGRLLLSADGVRHPEARRPGDEPLHPIHTNALPAEGTVGAADETASAAADTLTVDEDEPPTADVDPSAGSLWLRPYHTLVSEVSGETRRLLQVLRAPAPDVATRRSDTRGTFSSRAYVRTRGERPLHTRREAADDPAGLAIVLLLDRTTSMGPPPTICRRTGDPDSSFTSDVHRITHARRAAMLFELTCTTAGIPLCIGYAGDRGYSVHLPHALGEWVFFHCPERPVVWLRTWETPRFAEGPKALIAGLYGDSYSERVSASLRVAQAKLVERPERTKLILYVHDGTPTDEPPHEAAATVVSVRTHGIHVVGVFVGDQEHLPQLEAIFGADHTIAVTALSDLPRRLGRLLVRYTAGRRLMG